MAQLLQPGLGLRLYPGLSRLADAVPEGCITTMVTWMVALSPSRRMISPINWSAPTRTSSYMAAPA
jgi:hypothetical protein